jgi:hypothetical protein
VQRLQVHSTAAPAKSAVEAVPNATQFTEEIIADEKKCDNLT